MQDARQKEIKETIGEKLFEKYETQNLSPEEIPIVTMHDMGWNKQSSGNKYDSISGHRFLSGGECRKILNY